MKKTILFSLLMLSIPALRASDYKSLRSNLITMETVATTIMTARDIKNGKTNSYYYENLIRYCIPMTLAVHYETEINTLTPSGNLTNVLILGLLYCSIAHTIKSIWNNVTTNQKAAGQATADDNR